MDVDWLADVRKYVPDADEGVVGKIVKYCGIALRTPNAASVTFSDPTETERVRENYLKKKLGLTQDNATLDSAIAAVGERVGTEDGYRVTVYYLLAEHFGLLDTFGGAKGTASAATTAATAAAGAAASTTAASAATTGTAPSAAADTPIATAVSSTGGHAPTRPTGGGGGRRSGGGDAGDDGGIFGIGCVAGLVALGAIILAALIAVWAQSTILSADPEETAATAPAEPAPEPTPTPTPTETAEPEVPEGAGVTATERDGKPLLTVYFDSGSSTVAPDFEEVSTEIRGYLEDNPEATVQISGFNDPTGNAEINARLSRERAENVQAQLVGLGIAEDRTDLVKPDDTTTTDMNPAEARRVEITIVE